MAITWYDANVMVKYFSKGEVKLSFEDKRPIRDMIYGDFCKIRDKEPKFLYFITINKGNNKKIIDNNKQLYQDNIKAYNQFISLVAEVIKDIGISNNSFSYSQIIENLLLCGYLSDDGPFLPFRQINQKPLDILGFLGVDVINGRGCCRHSSTIHQDIFDCLKLYGDKFPCTSSVGIEFNYGFDQIFNTIKTTHQANILEYNGQYYVHDLFSGYHYFKDTFCSQLYENTSEFFPLPEKDRKLLYYIPYIDMTLNNLSYEQVVEKVENFMKSSEKTHIDTRELNEILMDTNERFNKSNHILDDFRLEVGSYIKKIISSTTK